MLRTAGAERAVRVLRSRAVGLRPPDWRRTGLPPGFRTAKTTLAAVLAYVVAQTLPGHSPPILAPLTALLVLQLTLYATVRTGLQRVASVVAGVSVAVLVSTTLGLRWWSLGLVIFVSIVIGRLLRLGEQLMEVPISAMLVLAVGGQTVVWQTRILETLVGAAVGVAVNAVLAPPVYLQTAGDAIGELAEDMGLLLRGVGEEVAQDWSHDRAKRWLDGARGLDRPIERAQAALARGEESLRYNPRRRRTGTAAVSLPAGLAALEHAAILLRGICRSLADRAELADPATAVPAPARRSLAMLLLDAAAAVTAFGAVVARDVTGPAPDSAELRRALAGGQERLATVATALQVDPATEPELWRVHGALLADLGRLLHELDLELGPDALGVRRPPPPAGPGPAGGPPAPPHRP